MAKIWGVNFFGHDASMCVVDCDKIIFHKLSGGDFLTEKLVNEVLKFGLPELICYYEKPFLKRLRHLYSGEWNKAFNLLNPKFHMMEFQIYAPIRYYSHHHSHAAASYFLSDYDDATILVADAVGEWETVTVWKAKNNSLTKLKSLKYPFSLGLFYTSFSKLYGVSEKTLMNLSLQGKPTHYRKVKEYMNKNLHKGIKNWEIIDDNIPCSVQKVFVDTLKDIIKPFEKLSKNLLITGGCAFNTLAVQELGAEVIISPGDSSSSIGSVAAHLNKKLSFMIDDNN